MLDYQLAHGTTPKDWKWGGVPFATSCDDQPDYGRCIQNLPHDFYGGTETDKVGELGGAYTLFYEMSGDRRYLDAAIRCADALAQNVKAGDDDHTPWPFRIDARTGETLSLEDYGGDVASSVRMFDELIRLKAGDTTAYQHTRELAWQWVLQHPLSTRSKSWDNWSGFFEDVPRRPTNVNQFLPDMTVYYILSRPDPGSVDREWVSHTGHIIDWVRRRFGRGPFLGAWAIDEQGTPDGRGCCSRAGQGSHGGRWAAINAMYAERTGDSQAREDYWCGGWDDGFPTCEACTHNGEQYPNLGEFRSVDWKVEALDQSNAQPSVTLSAFGPISPIQAEKRIRLRDRSVEVELKIDHLGFAPLDFIWGT
jgi:hypothetical protein